MITGIKRQVTARAARSTPLRIQPGLVQLAEAHDYARDVQADVWQYAVEIDSLRRLGLTPEDLRWLIDRGYVEHGCEITKAGDPARRFRRSRKSTFRQKTCFVVTAAGLSLTATAAVQRRVRRAG